MQTAVYILFVLGILGAVDIFLFHSISHGIRSHADSKAELLIHSLRGPTYAALFVLLPNFSLQGTYFWMLMAIFLFDFFISIADFFVEGRSREFFGGLPTGEYILHIVLAMLFGALVTSVALSAKHWAQLPTALRYAPHAVPSVLRALMLFMAFLVLASAVLDLVAARRLTQKAK